MAEMACITKVAAQVRFDVSCRRDKGVHELHVAATEELQRIRDIRLDGFQIAHLIHRHYERRPSPSREGPNPPPAVRAAVFRSWSATRRYALKSLTI